MMYCHIYSILKPFKTKWRHTIFTQFSSNSENPQLPSPSQKMTFSDYQSIMFHNYFHLSLSQEITSSTSSIFELRWLIRGVLHNSIRHIHTTCSYGFSLINIKYSLFENAKLSLHSALKCQSAIERPQNQFSSNRLFSLSLIK